MNRVSRATVASVAALACTVAAVASAGATSSAGLPRGGKVVARLSIPQGTGGLAVGEGAVWAMSSAVSTLTRIDPARNAVVARIKVKPVRACPQFPQSCGDAAAGE